jgi:hypothetical protein
LVATHTELQRSHAYKRHEGPLLSLRLLQHNARSPAPKAPPRAASVAGTLPGSVPASGPPRFPPVVVGH